jgi:hypothetical protein
MLMYVKARQTPLCEQGRSAGCASVSRKTLGYLRCLTGCHMDLLGASRTCDATTFVHKTSALNASTRKRNAAQQSI